MDDMVLAVPDLHALRGPSYYPVDDLLEELLRRGATKVRLPGGSGESASAKAAERLRLNRAGPRRRTPMLIPMMGYKPFSMFPYTYRYDVIPFCWDVWEPNYERWISLLRRHRVPVAFVTAQQSADLLMQRLPETDVRWMPEATSLAPSAVRPLGRRTTHVLELGRRSDAFHAAVTDVLSQDGWSHLYERQPGSVVYPSRRALLSGLADTVVSVCFPSSVTHPERSGSVSTMTQRYLETILSGAVPVGQAPDELVQLFGYNPVVEVDWRDPWSQLRSLLLDPDRWQPLADRNLARAREVGTWSVRVSDMARVLSDYFPSLRLQGA